MLSDDQTKAARWLDEVRQYLTAAADSSMSRNNSEQLAYELLEAFPAVAALFEVRKDHDALIRQMLAFAELVKRGLENGSVKAQPIIEIDDDAPDLVIKTLHGEAVGAITAARARLLDSDLSKLTERGAKAWAGVDPQKLREGGAL